MYLETCHSLQPEEGERIRKRKRKKRKEKKRKKKKGNEEKKKGRREGGKGKNLFAAIFAPNIHPWERKKIK